MTACTERHPPAPGDGVSGEGQKGMPRLRSMAACAERQRPAPGDGVSGEGQKGMPKVGTA